ncbi:MAG: class I SAM-dependent methyltransferase [Ktedonobacteraceae bacterium]
MSIEANQNVGNGRHYRDDVPYLLPMDLGEDERLNLQHFIFRYALKGNHAAPLSKSVTQILDVGSGPGIWGREVALQFPSASVFGVDLEPPHPVSSSTSAPVSPPNYHFVQGNVLQGLPFSADTFDFTHQRMLVAAIPTQDWSRVVQELARVTRPGGWIELMEYRTPLFNAGPATELLFAWTQDVLLSRGIDLSKTEEMGMMLTQAGLRQVTQQSIDVPCGAWDTQVGVLMERNLIDGFGGIKPVACKLLQIAPAEFDRQLATAVLECKERHTIARFYLVYGQV